MADAESANQASLVDEVVSRNLYMSTFMETLQHKIVHPKVPLCSTWFIQKPPNLICPIFTVFILHPPLKLCITYLSFYISACYPVR